MCKSWRNDEVLSRSAYYKRLCRAQIETSFGVEGGRLIHDRPPAAAIARSSKQNVAEPIDWFARYSALTSGRALRSSADDPACHASVLSRFLKTYSVLVAAKKTREAATPHTIKNRNKKKKPEVFEPLFTMEATEVRYCDDGESIVVDLTGLSIDASEVSTVELWLLDRSNGKLGLFSSHKRLFSSFNGINADLEIEHDHQFEMFDLQPPFNYGLDYYERDEQGGHYLDEFPYSKACPILETFAARNVQLKLYRAQFQFHIPEPPDWSFMPDNFDSEEEDEFIDDVINEWYEVNDTDRLLRMQLEFKYLSFDDYGDESTFKFSPDDLFLATRFMTWI